MHWTAASRDHGTFCISCHTTLPYVLSRPALGKMLGESRLPVQELLIENVRKRVRLWNEVAPFYTDKEYAGNRAAESRATESVLNALILASYDAGTGAWDNDARSALENMWALQITSGDDRGAWLWQQFSLKPWESSESHYYGAVLAELAVSYAPASYRSDSRTQSHVRMLREYLSREYSRQAMLNRVFLLWASTRSPELLTPQERGSLVQDIVARQRPDGGWSLPELDWTWRTWRPMLLIERWYRTDGSSQERGSDGLATALVTFTLQEAGFSRNSGPVKQGLDWLMRSQRQSDGLWVTYSLNRQRSLSSNTGRFMSDAATGFAVLALTNTGGKIEAQVGSSKAPQR